VTHARRSARLALVLVVLLALRASPARAGDADRDIMATIRAAGTFETLAGALEASGLARMLKEPGPFTLLAPTDEAFDRLPPEKFAALLGYPAQLVALLSRHIFREKITSTDLAARKTIDPLGGDSVRISFGSYGIKLDGAAVIRMDLAASNGVIHVIDTVLPPQ
jgi:uncharacterized surface protein with fasciclin (FAS1) repeats